VPFLAASQAVYIAFNVLAPRTQVVHKRGYARVLSLCANTSYFGWSQNRKILKVPYTHSQAKCLLEVSYSTDDPHLFCLDITETFATFVLLTSLEHSTGRKAFTFTNGFFFVVLCLWFAKHAWILKCVTFGEGDTDGGKGARRPSHTIATSLVADVWHHLSMFCYTFTKTCSP
jgi:hypothetical protein